jgi:hypothetical protein
MLIRDLPDHETDKTRPLADACLEFSVSHSSADDSSGEICQAVFCIDATLIPSSQI